jgi:hypothetical protein
LSHYVVRYLSEGGLCCFDLVREVASLECDILVAYYYLKAVVYFREAA